MQTKRSPYPSDLCDEDWIKIEKYMPAEAHTGRPRTNPIREVLNAILYVLRTGIPWEYLPHDFPPLKSVYHDFNQWCKAGIFEYINSELVPLVRVLEGRNPYPTAGIIDSQTKRTVQVKKGEKGYDGNKKDDGRKRHIIVDVLGLLLKVVVQPANIQDHQDAEEVLFKMKVFWSKVEYMWADGIYEVKSLIACLSVYLGITLNIVKSIKYDTSKKERLQALEDKNQPLLLDFEDAEGHSFTETEKKRGFKIIRPRWKVERTFAWLCKNRRLSKDYEVLPVIEESFCYLAMIQLYLRRLRM